MRILQISPQFPFPASDGGKIGISNIFKNLSHNNEVTFLCYSDKEIEKKHLLEASKYGEVIILKHNLENTPLRIFKSLFVSNSIYFSKYINQSVFDKIDNIIENGNFDIIHCDHSAIGQLGVYIKEKYGIPVGLRLHNIEYMIWQRYADELKKGNWKDKLQYFYIKDQANLLKYEETSLFPKLDVCFPITQVDLDRAKELSPDANLVLAKGGVDTELWKNNNIKKNKHEIVIASNYKWVHNVTGLIWFIENVMPKILKVIPHTKLKIIGTTPPEILSKYKHLNVEVLGYVSDVVSEIAKSSLTISPLFVGSGIRIKILESLSAGTPVVSTSIAAEGINATEKEGLYIADDKEEFAKMCLDLLNYDEKASQAAKQGRELIKKEYSMEKMSKVIIEEYKRILGIN